MNDNNKLPKQAKTQEFELIELLFREYISSHIARPDIEYSFQARFQSFINQIPSYLHSSSKTGFFTHFFFGSFASLLDTKLGQKLGIHKLHFNFDQANHLRIVAAAGDKTHIFIFTENNQKKKHHKKKKLDFTKDEWKTITGQEYTDDDNKKLEINVININKSTGSINVAVEKKSIQDGVSSEKQYHEITKQFVDKDGQYIALEDSILILSNSAPLEVFNELQLILEYTKKIHDHYPGLPYGAGAKEADEHGFVAGIFNNFRYRENTHAYLEQFAGKGYADIVLLVRGADRATKSIPIIIELKAGTGRGTNADDALRQVEEYTQGFQPNNMRILSLSDNILCVGMNLDMPTDSFIQTQVVARDQVVVPLIQQIINQLVTEDILNQNPAPDDLIVIQQTIKQYLEQTYNTFPGTGEKSSAHYMSRFILGESLVLRDYDKHIFMYDKESYIPTATVIDDHDTRSNKKPKIERTVDGSNAVNSLLFIPTSSANSPVILVNIIDVNRDVVVNNVRLDSGLIGNRKIVQLNIQFNIDKYKESFAEHCNIKLLKIYDSISEYNQALIQVQGKLHLIAEDISDNLLEHLQQTISSQKGLVISESYYKELMGKVGEVVYPIKSLIGRESEFQGLLEGIFKYYSDLKLSEGSERRELVLTEFQTGAGGRIDMLVQAIGSSEQGTKEYIPVGLELKYDDSIKLDSRGRKQDENLQKILLEEKEKQVVEKLLQDQTERYSKGAAIKSITDGNQVVIMGVVFNAQAKNADSLFLTTDQFTHATVVHSSKLYTISDINDKHDQLQEILKTHSNSIIMEYYNKIDVSHIENLAQSLSHNPYVQRITISNSEITNDAMTRLCNVLQNHNKITSISFINTNLDEEKAGVLINLLQQNNHIVHLDVTVNNNLNIEIQNKLNNLLHHNQRIHQKIKSIFALYTVDDMSSNVFIPDWVNIRRDQMRDNNIIVQNSDDIDRCYQDTALDLSNTMLEDSKIDQVVTWLKNHQDVDFLDLSNNQLSLIGLEKILDYLIGNQNKISLLDISENDIGTNSQAIVKLSSLIKRHNSINGPVLKFLNLHNIEIHYSDVYDIFAALVENTSIEHLSMSSNDLFSQIQGQVVQSITNFMAYILCTHPVLSTLDLSNTGLTNLVIEGIVRIQKTSQDSSIRITELNIAGNYITQDGMESLGQLISSAGQLQSLDISNNHIGTSNIHKLLNILSYTKISTLRISNIDLNNDIHNIGDVIKYLNIQNLDVSHNDIGTEAVINIFQSISYRMQHADNTLIQLNLSGNQINQDDTSQEKVITAMSNALENNQVLRSLDISDMNIQDIFLSQLVIQLIVSNIEHLNIAGNDISEFTISCLASYLLLNPPLKLLNISANTNQGSQSIIKAPDIFILFQALSGNNQLTHLDLSYNNLDYESIDIISKYLQQNYGLEYLDLADNNLSLDSICVLFQGLSSNSQLQYLDIRNNQQIDDQTALKMLEILKVNQGLKILYISRDNLSEDVISKFTRESLGITVEIDGYIPPRVNPMHRDDNLLDLDYQTFESETKLHKYNYWLQQHDILDIGRVQYGFRNNELEVIGSIDQLSRVINGYKSNNNNISPVSIICNIGNDNKGGNHWVSLVLNRQGTNYHGYYIDSSGISIPSNIASILNSYQMLIVSLSIRQQLDGYNCGFWALENAQKIFQVLQNNANTDLDTESLRDMLTSSRSADAWRGIRDNVYAQLTNDNIRIESLRTLALTQHSISVLDSQESVISSCLSPILRMKREIKQKCKIWWDDIDAISNSPTRNIEEIVIDAKKFLEYSKLHVEDEVKSLQLVRLIEEVRRKGDRKIVGKYQGLLEQVIQDKSYKNYLQQERINAIGHHVIDQDSYSISPRLKLKLINAAGKIQLIRGVHVLVVSCQEGLMEDCTLSVIEFGYSFLSQPIENMMVRTAPRMINHAANVASHIVPKLSHNINFVAQVLTRGYAVKLAKVGAGAIASIFDIVDIVIASNSLIECNKRAGSNNACSAKEIRDNIAVISFASVSFVSGVALTAIGAGPAAVGVGLVIMVGQGVYSGISNIIEYKEKYNTTHTENWHIFWRTFALQRMSEDIAHLVARDKTINDITENAWQILSNSNENIVAYAIGLGKEEVTYLQKCIDAYLYTIEGPYPYPSCSEYSNYNIKAAYSKIDMSNRAANTNKLSRVLPKVIANATMICLPKITEADYEKGLVQSRADAIYECDNAVVMVHKQRQSSLPMKDQYIVYDLRYVNSGSIIGSNETNNIFQIVQGTTQIFGGSNLKNSFNILNSKYHGKIYLSDNSTNIIDVSNLSDDLISMEYTHIYPLAMNMSIVGASDSSQLYARSKDIKIRYIGRNNKVDKIICKQLLYRDHKIVHDNEGEHNNIIIDSGGGKYYNSISHGRIYYDISNYDQIQNCSTVIVSPNTLVQGSQSNFTIYIQSLNYAATYRARSANSEIDIVGRGTVVFPEISLLQDSIEIKILPTNGLSIIMPLGHNAQYTLLLKNYLNEDFSTNYVLIDKYGSNIILKDTTSNNNLIIRHFVLYAECNFETVREVVEHYRNITYSREDYVIFSTVKNTQYNHFLKFGSSERDIIIINNDVVYVEGNDGSDLYIINNHIDYRVKINNKAEDLQLDILKLPVNNINDLCIIERTYHLHLLFNNSDKVADNKLQEVVIDNYFQDNIYQHIAIMGRKNNSYIFFNDSGVITLLPFYHTSLERNILVLSSNSKKVVIHINQANIVFYKQKNDLLLTEKQAHCCNSLSLILQDYYIKQHQWLDVKLYGYNNAVISIIDLHNITVSAINYEKEYNSIIKEYRVNLTVGSHEIEQNKQIFNNQLAKEDNQEKIGVVVLQSTSFDSVGILDHNNDLILSTLYNRTLTIKNWYKDDLYKISMFEFDTGIEPERVYVSHEFANKMKLNNRLSNEILTIDHTIVNAVISYVILRCGQQDGLAKILTYSFLEDENNRLNNHNLSLEEIIEGIQDGDNDTIGKVLLLLVAKAHNKLLLKYNIEKEDILQNSCFNTILSYSIIQEMIECINTSTNLSRIEQFINNKQHAIGTIIIELVTAHIVSDNHHKHRHHHGENVIDHRERRDIDHVSTKGSNHDHDDHLLDSIDDRLTATSASSSLKPLGYNIVNWVRGNIFKMLLEHNTNLNLKNQNDKTPMDLSREFGMNLAQFETPTPVPYKANNTEGVTTKAEELEHHYRNIHHHGEGHVSANKYHIDKNPTYERLIGWSSKAASLVSGFPTVVTIDDTDTAGVYKTLCGASTLEENQIPYLPRAQQDEASNTKQVESENTNSTVTIFEPYKIVTGVACSKVVRNVDGSTDQKCIYRGVAVNEAKSSGCYQELSTEKIKCSTLNIFSTVCNISAKINNEKVATCNPHLEYSNTAKPMEFKNELALKSFLSIYGNSIGLLTSLNNNASFILQLHNIYDTTANTIGGFQDKPVAKFVTSIVASGLAIGIASLISLPIESIVLIPSAKNYSKLIKEYLPMEDGVYKDIISCAGAGAVITATAYNPYLQLGTTLYTIGNKVKGYLQDSNAATFKTTIITALTTASATQSGLSEIVVESMPKIKDGISNLQIISSIWSVGELLHDNLPDFSSFELPILGCYFHGCPMI